MIGVKEDGSAALALIAGSVLVSGVAGFLLGRRAGAGPELTQSPRRVVRMAKKTSACDVLRYLDRNDLHEGYYVRGQVFWDVYKACKKREGDSDYIRDLTERLEQEAADS